MSPQQIALLATAILVAACIFIVPRIRRARRAAANERRRQQRIVEQARLVRRKAELEEGLANFPAQHRATVEKCQPHVDEYLLLTHLLFARSQFAKARNEFRIRNFDDALSSLHSAQSGLMDAERRAYELTTDKESESLLNV